MALYSETHAKWVGESSRGCTINSWTIAAALGSYSEKATIISAFESSVDDAPGNAVVDVYLVTHALVNFEGVYIEQSRVSSTVACVRRKKHLSVKVIASSRHHSKLDPVDIIGGIMRPVLHIVRKSLMVIDSCSTCIFVYDNVLECVPKTIGCRVGDMVW